MTAFYVYIIYSKSLNAYYTGHSSDLNKRLEEHNTGISAFTARASDWEVLYIEQFAERSAATAREKAIKKKKSRKYIEWLIEQG